VYCCGTIRTPNPKTHHFATHTKTTILYIFINKHKMENNKFGGKQNDIRFELKEILYVELPDCNLGFEIPTNQSKFNNEHWIKKYPNAHAIYKIIGQSPSLYVSKTKIK